MTVRPAKTQISLRFTRKRGLPSSVMASYFETYDFTLTHTQTKRKLSICQPQHDKPNKVSLRPAKTQISLGIRPVGSASSVSAWRNLGSLAVNWTHSEDSDQTGRMPRLIWLGWCQSWSESSLGAHSFYWFCHVVAQVLPTPILQAPSSSILPTDRTSWRPLAAFCLLTEQAGAL